MPETGSHSQTPDNTPPWLSYQHPAVRDLVWLIASPPLLPDPGIAALPASIARWPEAAAYLALYRRHEQWLRRLDADPQPLLAFCAQSRDHRLGRYAEDLLQFWLAAPDNPEFELITSHEPLRENGITLGEPDFLVRERVSGQLWHIELALKFYLGTSDQQWLGPNRQDSLARKLDHLCRHQLPLLQTAAGKTWLQTRALETPAPWAWLKGRLFSPAHPNPDAAGLSVRQMPWFTPQTLNTFARQHAYQWFTLAKCHWLAPQSSTPDQHAPFDLVGSSNSLSASGAQALIAFQGRHEVLRAFVVAENWALAPISLR